MNSLKRKLIELFEENLRLRPENLMGKLNSTEENGKGEKLLLLCMKLTDSLNPGE